MDKMKKLYSVKELIAENGGPLPLSRAAIYAAIRSGKIPSICIGRRIFISEDYLKKLGVVV